MMSALHTDAAYRSRLQTLATQLGSLLQEIQALAAASAQHIHAAHPNFRKGAENLTHYLALRRRDLRRLQEDCAQLGLSSLGRCESHVLASVQAAHALARAAAGDGVLNASPVADDFVSHPQLLAAHAQALFGAAPQARSARIMVTMPAEAAGDYALVRDLMSAGMNCARINCAHDDEGVWSAIIEHVHKAETELDRRCYIFMDLAGPKLRTRVLPARPMVLKLKPPRDEYGRLTAPARGWLTCVNNPQPAPADMQATIPVAADWLEELRVGDAIHLRDASGSRRIWRVTSRSSAGCVVESRKTCYVVRNLRLTRIDSTGRKQRSTAVESLPHRSPAIVLQPGDELILTAAATGELAQRDESGALITPAVIGCTLAEVFKDLRAGEPIWFDDGRIGGMIEAVGAAQARVRISHTGAPRAKLRTDKGINLPESNLAIAALTAKDLIDLPFIARHADMVGYSFVSRTEDVLALQKHLDALSDDPPAIVLKIETQRAFGNLPALLLTAMRAERCGVMIARGDLAIECGYERLAEVQEELLWLCEAAHVPVIWATNVLDQLARSGAPSRAEVSDAAMSHRAECVMLNKGPYIRQAVSLLDGVLRRMQAHQLKKTARFRALDVANGFQP